MKPDITAPGEYLVSSMSNSSYSVSDNSTEIQRGDTVIVNGINYYWGAIRGTSMSSPMVAGTLALRLEANPNLTPEDVREIFSETAIRDEWTGSQPNNTWGYGKLDAWGGLKKVLELNGIEENYIAESNNGVKVFANNGLLNILFTNIINNCSISVYDITGKIITNKFIGSANAGDEICINNISNKGIYIIKIDGDSFATVQKIIL